MKSRVLLVVFVFSLGCIFRSVAQHTIFIPELSKANSLFESADYPRALVAYQKFTSSKGDSLIHPEVLYRIAYCMIQEGHRNPEAMHYLERYIRLSENHFEAFYLLGNYYHSCARLDAALELYNKFIGFVEQDTTEDIKIRHEVIQTVKREIAGCEFAKVQLASHPDAIAENLGAGINTPYPEYAPVVSDNDSVLFFTRRGPESTGGKKTRENEYYEDIYKSVTDSGKFSKCVQMSASINSGGNDGALQLSKDNSRLYLYRKGKICYSSIYGGIFLDPKEIEKKNDITDHNANEPNMYISPDGNTIFFSSDRAGGSGGLDIYKSSKGADGIWSKPENLGDNVNTRFDEDYPFYDVSDSTLYFSSKGLLGMGGYDVFKSQWKNGFWSPAVNMGYPVNSPADDITFFMIPSKTHAYLASDRYGGLGGMDLYRLSNLKVANLPAAGR